MARSIHSSSFIEEIYYVIFTSHRSDRQHYLYHYGLVLVCEPFLGLSHTFSAICLSISRAERVYPPQAPPGTLRWDVCWLVSLGIWTIVIVWCEVLVI